MSTGAFRTIALGLSSAVNVCGGLLLLRLLGGGGEEDAAGAEGSRSLALLFRIFAALSASEKTLSVAVNVGCCSVSESEKSASTSLDLDEGEPSRLRFLGGETV